MAELRGRPFAFVVLAIGTWVGARIALTQSPAQPPSVVAQPQASMVALLPQLESEERLVGALPTRTIPLENSRHAFVGPTFRPPPALVPWQAGGWPSGLSSNAWVAGDDKPLSTGRDTPPTNALALAGKAGPPENKRHWGAKIYAYSFWRIGRGGNTALAPGAQYGGSQSGLVATLDPFASPDRGIALLFRGYATPKGHEREAALGLRWSPWAKLPLSLSAERRFRHGAADAFAAYVAGGVDDVRLAGNVKLEAFGQAGFVGGPDSSGFFDVQARAMQPIAGLGGITLRAGGGAWAGGQKGTERLDAGPVIEARINNDVASFRIQLDWRQRLAGNAAPKSGLALTVSTGF